MFNTSKILLPKFLIAIVVLGILAVNARAETECKTPESLLSELESSSIASLEELVKKGSGLNSTDGFASYYAKRFEGKRTTSGHRYHPEKMTAAHHNLPMGTVVRVFNPATSQEVNVTINDRCARKSFPFIDLSRAAAKKIGLWGKGRIKVVITPLLQENLEEPTW